MKPSKRKDARQSPADLRPQRNGIEPSRTPETVWNSQAQLQTIIENIDEGLVVYSMDGRLFHWNHAALALHGFTGISEAQSHFSDFADIFVLSDLDGNILPLEQWPLARILRGERLRDHEVRIRSVHDDWERIYKYGGGLVRNPAGRQFLAVLTINDVTERKGNEEALRRYELLANESRDIILLVRKEDGRLLDVNVAATIAYGYSRDELLRLTIGDLRAPQETSFTFEQMSEADVQGTLFETVQRHSSGRTFPVEVSSRGATIGGQRTLIRVIRDITSRKQAEEALKRSEEALRRANEQLENRIGERTEELAKTVDNLRQQVVQRQLVERQLIEANRQLESRAAQLRALAGELTLAEQHARRRLAKVLHDHLQQLLVGAKFRTAILGRNPDPSARQTADEIDGLLDDAVKISRSLTAELSPPILHEASLPAAFEWLARWMLDKHGLVVDLTLGDDCDVHAEDIKVLLFEGVRELLLNVVKHAGTRSARVEIHRANDETLEITVADDGSGFDPAVTVQRKAGASLGGFGLFSIRERLGMIGGSMEISATPGQGTRVAIRAPLEQSYTQKPVSMLTEYREKAVYPAAAAVNGRIRVMLADDHMVMRQGLARLLDAEEDIQVVGEASDGWAAVELARQLVPDVVLMDVSMPNVNGIEATRMIHSTWPEIRIIGLSMFEESEQAEAMVNAGAVAYLSKSGPAHALLEAIRATPIVAPSHH